MKKRVILGMSGGMDSSVAAYMLKEQGYQVTGLTLTYSQASSHCTQRNVIKAKKVSRSIGIEHQTIDVTNRFQKEVVDYFVDEYKRGRTPNPCAVCNRKIKFSNLIEKAKELDAEYIATGHYANIQKDDNNYYLLKGKDKKKDQSYFLARLKREWLKNIIFPLGEYTKKEVLSVAEKSKLTSFNMEESQEICFIKGNNYRDFLLDKVPHLMEKGPVVDINGNIIGIHEGILSFTIGQRKGIQVNINQPLYVVDIDAENNTVIIGEKEDTFKRKFLVENINWLVPQDEIPQEVTVKIRSQHNPARAKIKKINSSALVEFIKPQMAITPGQLAVFYKDNIVLGSGWIGNSSG
jgi:tRNA-specific 2-thiouridylase